MSATRLTIAVLLLANVSTVHAEALARVSGQFAGNAPSSSEASGVYIASRSSSFNSHVVFASADAITGELKVSGSSDPNNDGVRSASFAQIRQGLAFEVPGLGPATVTFNAYLTGSIAAQQGVALGTLAIGGDSGSGSLDGMGLAIGNDLPWYCDADPRITCLLGTEVRRRVSYSLALPTGRSAFDFIVSLSGSAQMGGAYDFANTAHVWIDVPEGVTMTASTDRFLAEAAPVPEPATYMLLIAGLALVLARRCMSS